MTHVRPTVLDIPRSVARLDENADFPERGSKMIDGVLWESRDQLRRSVADNISFVIGATVRLRKITRRDTAIMLASAGASPFTIEQHARAIAGYLRENADRDGRWSADI